MPEFFDRHARIVIIGGGAIGCAVAYALTRRGERDVLLLEKSQVTNGCTWHAAGLVGQLRGRKNLTRLMQNSVAVFDSSRPSQARRSIGGRWGHCGLPLRRTGGAKSGAR